VIPYNYKRRNIPITGSLKKAASQKQAESLADASAARPLRADGRRNREALLVTARAAFTAGEAEIQIEEIARRTSVGIGTFYRHFESREALIEAIYRQEMDTLCASADRFLERLPPQEALPAFLHHLVQYLVANVCFGTTMVAILTSSSISLSYGNEHIMKMLDRLLISASATGHIRSDVAPEIVMMALNGLCIGHGQTGWEERANAVVDLILSGLRYGTMVH
jgi:AcrR family transcriptional regulator